MSRFLAVLTMVLLGSGFLLAGCGGGSSGWTELLTNGGFETGDLTGWTFEPTPEAAGDVYVIAGVATPRNAFPTAGPSEGTYYAVFEQDENFAGALFQSFTVPDGDEDVVLTFDMFVYNSNGDTEVDGGFIGYSGLVENQHVRVNVLPATAGTFDVADPGIQNVYLDVDGDTMPLPYISYEFDLPLTPGETYRLRFAESSNMGYMSTGVDNVSVKSK